MTMERKPIVALCGPSGIGKERVKDTIKGAFAVAPSEPVVMTTRPSRENERGSRTTGILESDFKALVSSGQVVLPHRPFRGANTAIYGFSAESFEPATAQLTEVHSTIIEPFRNHNADRPTLVIGMVARVSLLEQNLLSRSPGAQPSDIELRLHLAEAEMEEIVEATKSGLVDAVFSFDQSLRDQSAQIVADMVGGFYG
jgi:guanylate kinase